MITKQFNAREAGHGHRHEPADSSRSRRVRRSSCIVCAGYPADRLLRRAAHLLVMNGANGKGRARSQRSGDTEDEPTWQPNGSLIAYRRGADQNATPGRSGWSTSRRARTTAHDDDRRARRPPARVLARRQDDRVHPPHHRRRRHHRRRSLLRPHRLDAPPGRRASRIRSSTSTGRPWSPDGRAILVVATDPTDANQTELGEYTSAKPFSTSPADWQSAGADHRQDARDEAGRGRSSTRPSRRTARRSRSSRTGPRRTCRCSGSSPRRWSNGQLGTPKGVTPVDPGLRGRVALRRRRARRDAADNCSSGQGAIVRVKLLRLRHRTSCAPPAAQNPSWQFVHLRDMLCRSCRRQVSRTTTSATSAAPRSPGAGSRSSWSSATAAGSRSLADLTLGRGADNLIRIDGETVSRQHAKIVIEPAGGRSSRTPGRRTGRSSTARRSRRADAARRATVKLGDLEMQVEPRSASEARERRRRSSSAPSRTRRGRSMRTPRLRPGTKLKRLEAERGRPALRAARPRRPLRADERGRRRLVELLNGETSLGELITARGRALRRRTAPSRLASLLADLGDRGPARGRRAETPPPPPKNALMRIFRTRQWDRRPGRARSSTQVYRGRRVPALHAPVVLLVVSRGRAPSAASRSST